MDTSSASGLTAALSVASQARTGDAIAVTVLKKAMDMQAEGAMQLLETLPQPASNPPHLGQSIDVKA